MEGEEPDEVLTGFATWPMCMQEQVIKIRTDLLAKGKPRCAQRMKELKGTGGWVRPPVPRGCDPSHYSMRDIFVDTAPFRARDDAAHPCLRCPNCRGGNTWIHGFQDLAPARRVTSMKNWYGLMGVKMECHDCSSVYKREKVVSETRLGRTLDGRKAADRKASLLSHLLVVTPHALPRLWVQEINAGPFRFMSTDEYPQSQLPQSEGYFFPAVLTASAAIDKECLEFMRPCVHNGMSVEAFSNLVVELHAKEFAHAELRFEEALQTELNGAFSKFTTDNAPSLGHYNDRSPNGYGGFHPCAPYWSAVYKKFVGSVREHYDQQVKMRRTPKMCIDASYPTAKRLGMWQGHRVFNCLQTAANDYGECINQFFAVSDSQDQMKIAIAAMVLSMIMLGQEPITTVTVDNPSDVKSFYEAQIPSIPDGQSPPAPAPEIPVLPVPEDIVQVLSASVSIGNFARSVLDEVEACTDRKVTMSLDAEWNTVKNPHTGKVIAADQKAAIIQLAYDFGHEGKQICIIQLTRLGHLPPELISLFKCDKIRFVGRNVWGDIMKLSRTFPDAKLHQDIDKKRRAIELGKLCAMRDRVRVPKGTVGLDTLSAAILGKSVPKSPVRLSPEWTNQTLSNEQKEYAARDALAGLLIYEAVMKFEDPTVRLLPKDDNNEGRFITVMPLTGNVAVLAMPVAEGQVIQTQGFWTNPLNQKKVKVSEHSALVRLDKVMAPAFKLHHRLGSPLDDPTRNNLVLGDYVKRKDEENASHFEVMLPLKSLRPTDKLAEAEHAGDADSGETERPGERATVGHADGEVLEPGKIWVCCDGCNTWKQTMQIDADDADDDWLCARCQSSPFDREEAEEAVFRELEGEEEDGDLDVVIEDGRPFRDEEVAQIMLCEGRVTAATTEAEAATHGGARAQEQEDEGHDAFSHVLGDILHAEKRPQCRVKHEWKKAFSVSQRDAFLVMDPTILAEVIVVLKLPIDEGGHGLDAEGVNLKLLYDFGWFKKRVPRTAPASRLLHARVKAVYHTYSDLVDSKTKEPLFNKEEKKKMENVLEEIRMGLYSDPPGVNFYHHAIDKDGAPVRDKHGLFMYR
jgi:hypothetical protein